MTDFLLMVGGALFAMFISGIVNYKKTAWVGLTEQERNDCLVSADPCEALATPEAQQLMEDVEAKLKEKNT